MHVHTETVRLPLETQLSRLLASHPLFQRTLAALPPPDLARTRRALSAHALHLSEELAPEVHRLAHRVRELFGIEKPFEIFQSTGRDPLGLDASVHSGPREPILFHLEGRLLTMLGEDEMLVVLGHEFGHFLAHSPDGALPVLPGPARQVAGQLTSPLLQETALNFSMAAELTADRFGLLAAGDLEAFLRVEMVHASGLPSNSLPWKPQAYLAQCRRLMEETLASGAQAFGTTHPEHNLRSYAAWLFSRSEMFAELTGRGSGDTRLEEVNATLTRLLLPGGVPELKVRGRGFAGRGRQAGIGATPFQGSTGPTRSRTEAPTTSAAEELVTEAVERASTALKPGLARLKRATAQGLERVVGRPVRFPSQPATTSASDDNDLMDFDDPEEKELLARFAALEKRFGESPSESPPPSSPPKKG